MLECGQEGGGGGGGLYLLHTNCLFYDTRFTLSLLVIVNLCFNISLDRKCGAEIDIVSVGSPTSFIYFWLFNNAGKNFQNSPRN
jgi:hypothetical protein